MELHPSSSSGTCLQTYIDGNKTLKYHLGIYFAVLHGKEAVDGLAGPVKRSAGNEDNAP